MLEGQEPGTSVERQSHTARSPTMRSYQVADETVVLADSTQDAGGANSSSWMLSGSRKTRTDP
jgi:hypothetical protein